MRVVSRPSEVDLPDHWFLNRVSQAVAPDPVLTSQNPVSHHISHIVKCAPGSVRHALFSGTSPHNNVNAAVAVQNSLRSDVNVPAEFIARERTRGTHAQLPSAVHLEFNTHFPGAHGLKNVFRPVNIFDSKKIPSYRNDWMGYDFVEIALNGYGLRNGKIVKRRQVLLCVMVSLGRSHFVGGIKVGKAAVELMDFKTGEIMQTTKIFPFVTLRQILRNSFMGIALRKLGHFLGVNDSFALFDDKTRSFCQSRDIGISFVDENDQRKIKINTADFRIDADLQRTQGYGDGFIDQGGRIRRVRGIEWFDVTTLAINGEPYSPEHAYAWSDSTFGAVRGGSDHTRHSWDWLIFDGVSNDNGQNQRTRVVIEGTCSRCKVGQTPQMGNVVVIAGDQICRKKMRVQYHYDPLQPFATPWLVVAEDAEGNRVHIEAVPFVSTQNGQSVIHDKSVNILPWLNLFKMRLSSSMGQTRMRLCFNDVFEGAQWSAAGHSYLESATIENRWTGDYYKKEDGG